MSVNWRETGLFRRFSSGEIAASRWQMPRKCRFAGPIRPERSPRCADTVPVLTQPLTHRRFTSLGRFHDTRSARRAAVSDQPPGASVASAPLVVHFPVRYACAHTRARQGPAISTARRGKLAAGRAIFPFPPLGHAKPGGVARSRERPQEGGAPLDPLERNPAGYRRLSAI